MEPARIIDTAYEPLGLDVQFDDDGVLESVVDWRLSLKTQDAVVGVAMLAVMAIAGTVGGVVVRVSLPGIAVLAAAAVAFVYWAAAHWFNTTMITLDQDFLVVTVGPLPWAGNRRVACESIVQLEVSAQVSNGKVRDHRIHALLDSGERLTLVDMIASAADAQYLLEHLEETLEFEA